MPRRPALGAVLDALVSWEGYDVPPSNRVALGGAAFGASAWSESVVMGVPGGNVEYRWVTTDPAEAYEILQARDLIPMEYVGRFVCERCYGSGRIVIDYDDGETMGCHLCDAGHLSHPPTVAALAAWASLGFAASDDGTPGILGAEELAGDDVFAGAVFSHPPPVWWRVSAPGGDEPRAYRSGSPKQALLDAGFGWRRRATHTALYVPPLGVEV